MKCKVVPEIPIVRWLRKNKMRSVVGQIHDSIVADVHRDELDDFLAGVKHIMTEDIQKAWEWIIVPLSIEAKMGERNRILVGEMKDENCKGELK